MRNRSIPVTIHPSAGAAKKHFPLLDLQSHSAGECDFYFSVLSYRICGSTNRLNSVLQLLRSGAHESFPASTFGAVKAFAQCLEFSDQTGSNDSRRSS